MFNQFLFRLVLTGVALFSTVPVFAQLDTIHYLPPVCRCYSAANQGGIYISTPSPTPVAFTIRDGEGNLLVSDSVSNSNYYRYFMNGNNPDVFVTSTELGVVQTGRGFIVRAEEPIYANLRYEMVNDNQAISVTSKGRKALGQSFRLMHVRSNADNRSYATFTIMGTQPNTLVGIDLSGINLTLTGPNAPAANQQILITLNEGETYTLAARTDQNSAADLDSLLGRLVTSNKPIVMVMGNWLSTWFSGNWDIGFDQPVAENLLGTQYVLTMGGGDTLMERAFVIANENNTEVFINGATTPVVSLNAGEFLQVDGSNYTADSVMFIQTSRPAYVWQVIFGRVSWANWGLNFLPPVSCLTENFVDNIPAIDSVGSLDYTGNVNLVTTNTSTVTINGAPVTAPPIPIPGSNFTAYRIKNLTGNIAVNATEVAVVGFYGARGPSTYSGYYSGFDSIPEISVSITDTICPDSLFVLDGFDSYQWLINGVVDPTATDTFYALNAQTGSFNVVVSKAFCRDTSGTYTVSCVLPVGLSAWEVECNDASRDFYWRTEFETGSQSFLIENGDDRGNWEIVGRVAAAGESLGSRDYRFKYENIVKGNNWRLRQVDFNGNETLSSVIRDECERAGPMLWVVGNQLYWTGWEQAPQLTISGLDGKSVWSSLAVSGEGNCYIGPTIPEGLYLLRASNGVQTKAIKITLKN